MSKIIIQIDDSDVAIKRLSSILDMKICTPLYRRRVHDFNFTKCSGTFEIRIGDFVCYFPQMMLKLNKRLFIAKIECISTKELSLDKKKQSLKDVSIDCYSYAIQDRMQETAINIYHAMDTNEKNSKRGRLLKNYLVDKELNTFEAIFTHGNIKLLKMYLDFRISPQEDLQFAIDLLGKKADITKNYLEMKAYLLQALNERKIISKYDFSICFFTLHIADKSKQERKIL